jgi:hypothetical protein
MSCQMQFQTDEQFGSVHDLETHANANDMLEADLLLRESTTIAELACFVEHDRFAFEI